MKKSLILALAALPAMAGEPVTIPAPAPAPAPCPYSFEIGTGYSWASKDLMKDIAPAKEIDMINFDVTGIYALDENLSVNLRLGYAFGDENNKYDLPMEKWETDMHVFTLMPGVRYTHPINDTISAFAGANIGLANVSIKEHYRGPNGDGTAWTDDSHDSEWGFAYSAEIGLQHKITETISAFAAWQVSGNTAAPTGYNDQVTTGIRAGVNIKF